MLVNLKIDAETYFGYSLTQAVITYFKVSQANNEGGQIKFMRKLMFMMGIFEFQKENEIKFLKVSMATQHERGI